MHIWRAKDLLSDPGSPDRVSVEEGGEAKPENSEDPSSNLRRFLSEHLPCKIWKRLTF